MVDGGLEERETQDSQLFMTDSLTLSAQPDRFPEISSPNYLFMELTVDLESATLMVTTPTPQEANHL